MTQQEFCEKVKVLEDQIKKSQAELEELKTVKIEAEQPKQWEPDFGDDYFAIFGNGDIDTSNWENDKCGRWRYLTGNCFKTEEEAEEYKKQIEYIARYKNYIEEHSEPLDWKNEEQTKYFASFYHSEIRVGYCWVAKNQGTICATSEQIILDAIKEIGEDNFKKYVLRVE